MSDAMSLQPQSPASYSLPLPIRQLDDGRQLTIATVLDGARRDFLERAFPDHPSVKVVLELGCGGGASATPALELLHPRRYIGLDQSPEVLRAAGRELSNHEGIEFHTHDLTRPLPATLLKSLPPETVVWASLVFSHLPNAAMVAERIFNELPVGSTMVLMELNGIQIPKGPYRETLKQYYGFYSGGWNRAGNKLFVGTSVAEWARREFVEGATGFAQDVSVPVPMETALKVVNTTSTRLEAEFQAKGWVDLAGGMSQVRSELFGPNVRTIPDNARGTRWMMTEICVVKNPV